MKLNLSAIAIVVILIVICMLYNTFSKMPGIKTQKEQFFGIGSFGGSLGESLGGSDGTGKLFIGDIIRKEAYKSKDACKNSTTKSGICTYNDLSKAKTDCKALPNCVGINMVNNKSDPKKPQKAYFLASSAPAVCTLAVTDPKTYQTQCTNAKKELLPKLSPSKPQSYKSLTGAFGKSNSNSCNNQCSPVSPDADTKGTQWCGGCYGMPALILADQGVKGNHMELNAIPVNSSGSDFSLSSSHFELFTMPNMPNVPGLSKKKPTAKDKDKDKKTDAGKDKAGKEIKSKYKEKQKAFAEKSNKYFSKAKSIGNKINDHFFGWL
jgi:hypothetical protein